MVDLPAEKKTPLAALVLALVCSLVTGAAQLGLKGAVERWRNHGWADPTALLLLVAAGFLLATGWVALLLALRSGELSTLYPVLAARYIWVVAATPLLFATESLNFYKIVGAGLAAVGVVIVARAGTR